MVFAALLAGYFVQDIASSEASVSLVRWRFRCPIDLNVGGSRCVRYVWLCMYVICHACFVFVRECEHRCCSLFELITSAGAKSLLRPPLQMWPVLWEQVPRRCCRAERLLGRPRGMLLRWYCFTNNNLWKLSDCNLKQNPTRSDVQRCLIWPLFHKLQIADGWNDTM